MGGGKQQQERRGAPQRPPPPEEDVLDSYCILGDVFALGTYAAVSAGADAIFNILARVEQVRNSVLLAFFQPMAQPELLAVNDPFLTGTLLITAWLVAGTAIGAFNPSSTQTSVQRALLTTGKVSFNSFDSKTHE
jgi:hypothetical protein